MNDILRRQLSEDVLSPLSVGFDRIFDIFDGVLSNPHFSSGKQSYPPFNIIKDGHKYTIEVAVAGFDKSELNVDVENGLLTIYSVGKKTPDADPQKFVHKGIAGRNFNLKWQLADYVVVQSAALANGMLRVELEEIIPEHMKRKSVDIIDFSDKK